MGILLFNKGDDVTLYLGLVAATTAAGVFAYFFKQKKHEVLVSADLFQIEIQCVLFAKHRFLPIVSQGWWPPLLHFP